MTGTEPSAGQAETDAGPPAVGEPPPPPLPRSPGADVPDRPRLPRSPGADVPDRPRLPRSPGADVPDRPRLPRSPGADVPDRPEPGDPERMLDPRMVQVWRVMTAVGATVPLAVGTVLALSLLGRLGWLVALAGVPVLTVLAAWYPRARYDRWRWQLTPLALELRHGVVVHQQAVPYFRIQQIDIVRGPVDRLLDLASLQVTTASASGSATIPGIAAAEASVVRAELLARAADAVTQHGGDISDAV